ncbi:hypothetical protein SUN_0796 [Sulfurovum sp. NBC37-1]|nr:hypothetical protein SUN_0796 [Sulfurovum sp. NBC37-1]
MGTNKFVTHREINKSKKLPNSIDALSHNDKQNIMPKSRNRNSPFFAIIAPMGFASCSLPRVSNNKMRSMITLFTVYSHAEKKKCTLYTQKWCILIHLIYKNFQKKDIP